MCVCAQYLIVFSNINLLLYCEKSQRITYHSSTDTKIGPDRFYFSKTQGELMGLSNSDKRSQMRPEVHSVPDRIICSRLLHYKRGKRVKLQI